MADQDDEDREMFNELFGEDPPAEPPAVAKDKGPTDKKEKKDKKDKGDKKDKKDKEKKDKKDKDKKEKKAGKDTGGETSGVGETDGEAARVPPSPGGKGRGRGRGRGRSPAAGKENAVGNTTPPAPAAPAPVLPVVQESQPVAESSAAPEKVKKDKKEGKEGKEKKDKKEGKEKKDKKDKEGKDKQGSEPAVVVGTAPEAPAPQVAASEVPAPEGTAPDAPAPAQDGDDKKKKKDGKEKKDKTNKEGKEKKKKKDKDGAGDKGIEGDTEGGAQGDKEGGPQEAGAEKKDKKKKKEGKDKKDKKRKADEVEGDAAAPAAVEAGQDVMQQDILMQDLLPGTEEVESPGMDFDGFFEEFNLDPQSPATDTGTSLAGGTPTPTAFASEAGGDIATPVGQDMVEPDQYDSIFEEYTGEGAPGSTGGVQAGAGTRTPQRQQDTIPIVAAHWRKIKRRKVTETHGTSLVPTQGESISDKWASVMEAIKATKPLNINSAESIKWIADFVQDMIKAAEADVKDFEAGDPMVHKMALLDKATTIMKKYVFGEIFVSCEGCRALAMWLSDLPDGSLPNIHLRSTLLDCMARLPITKETLKSCGDPSLGKVVQGLMRNRNETVPNRKAAALLVQKWVKQVLEKKIDIDTFMDTTDAPKPTLERKPEETEESFLQAEEDSFKRNHPMPPVREGKEYNIHPAAVAQPVARSKISIDTHIGKLNEVLKVLERPNKKFWRPYQVSIAGRQLNQL